MRQLCGRPLQRQHRQTPHSECTRIHPTKSDTNRTSEGVGRASVRPHHTSSSRRAGAQLSHRSRLGRELLGAKKDGSRVSDEIVAACGELIESWLPNFDGTILYVPSANPNRIVVPDFAGRLAHLMDLPLSHCLTKSRSTFPQKTMENSAQQISNIDGSFQLCEPLPKGSVLLVDDIVYSRWTMTVLGELLLSQGIGPVFPFAIARSKG